MRAWPPTHIIYLHGFRSSPASFKARRMAAAIADLPSPPRWSCPQLPASPAAAMTLIRTLAQEHPSDQTAVIGSSLGGFYALQLGRELGCRCVVINPAVHPARDLAGHIGEHPAWHDPAERIHFEPAHVQQLQALENTPAVFSPPLLALIAKGDEVLDWREMRAACKQGDVRLIEGADHALSDFEPWVPHILQFLQLA